MLRGKALRGNWAALLALGMFPPALSLFGQQTFGPQIGPPIPNLPPTPAQQSTNGSGNSGSGSNGTGSGAGMGSNGTGSNTGTSRGSSGTRGAGNAADGPVSGRIVLSDGAELAGRITVQRICGATVTGEAFTDSTGHFSIQRASNLAVTNADANNSALWGCELRGSLAGYRSDSIPLGRRDGDGSDVVIVLRRVGAKPELTITATTLLAPKEAHKSYEKGLEAIRRNHPDEAQKDFAGAVQIYPRFAAAWIELGKVYEQRNHLDQARDAYQKAADADAEYLYSYERLYRLDIRQTQWKEAADASARVLHLNPYEFPEAYYFNAVSNLALHNLSAAERSAREAVKLEGEQAEPRGNYVLGVILFNKGDLDGAANSMRALLSTPPNGPEWKSGEVILARIENQIAQRPAHARQ